MKKNFRLIILLNVLITGFTYHSFAQPDSWLQKSNFEGAGRYGSVSFNIETKGYIGTGYSTVNEKDFWEYDPLSDSWSQKADFGGSGRVFASGFSIGTKGYIGCGDDGNLKNDFWEYDPLANAWSQKADFGGLPRNAAVGFSIGSKGYLGTGLTDFSTRVNDFWEYDPATDVWIQKTNVGGPVRAFATGFSIGEKAYIGTGNSGNLEKDFWEYDPLTDIWIQKADFGGSSRFGAVGLSIGANGYIGCGDIGSNYTNDFWEYNPANDNWTKIADLGGEIRTLSAGFSIGYKGYVGTGFDKFNGKNDFWEYTPLCTPPVISSEPVNQSLTYGVSAIFMVTASDANSYQWQEDSGSGFIDITDGGIYSDATNDTLTISLPTIDMTGYKYRCVITGQCLFTATSDGNATLTVAAMEVMVTPDADQNKVFGSDDPTPFTYTYSPSLVGTDVLTGALSREAGEDVGNYAFTPGDLSAGSNYSLTIDATPAFNITALPIVITPDSDQNKEYGSDDPTPFTYTYSPSLLGSDAFSGLLSRSSGEDVGNYVYSTGTLTAGDNYSLSVAATTTFDITAKTLTITAEDKEKCFDGAIYSGDYTVTYNGFANSEDQDVLGGTLNFGGEAISATGIGSYTITPSGLTSSNYNLSFVDGSLALKSVPATPTITLIVDSIVSSSATGNQWYFDGNEIPGATDDFYIATENGTYYTVVTEGGCSSAPSNSIVILNVSIKETGAELFDVYPNPSTGVFNIKMKTTGKSLYNIEIYNSLGALILKQNNAIVDGKNIKLVDLSGQKSGLYTVILKNRTNSFVKKVYITK